MIHLLHVTTGSSAPAMFSAPAVDELPVFERLSPKVQQQQAEVFVRERFLSKLHDLQPRPEVHIVRVCASASCVTCRLSSTGVILRHDLLTAPMLARLHLPCLLVLLACPQRLHRLAHTGLLTT